MATTVNTDTLRRLKSEVGEDTVTALLTVFSDELSQYHSQLSGSPSIEQVREISHAIKSSAASFGADDLAEMARECESRVKQGQQEWMTHHLDELTEMLRGTASTYREMAVEQSFINSLT
ncbi:MULTISPECIES: Hpt domain-containing protein [Salinivibrio]|jgi:Hpt domain.|uniref:Phosphorelay protein LuxU n=1 Tax=Salinivibrio kushneri TaxID=1908198 RepID=A0AB36KAX0_9GAMM|nr:MULTISPECIES: Hpt domain-containing protein [Salinivibrio]ODP98987.1 phosphorelay protein LuxU [Salinivibrio sp. BNH]OOE35023.1 phosphorelay protein LuxU [Salinivibrio kushneri]OOE36929.1 phosphorelay protein LuxU [Salinivibrio kushneri]OOE39241.1 phosphorelay protein LuxU [Salinivibrio kushneri]OOE46540.1 phosphorelay protein LuxU [Salinivibrio kushneri]